jgi:hypothetical protein
MKFLSSDIKKVGAEPEFGGRKFDVLPRGPLQAVYHRQQWQRRQRRQRQRRQRRQWRQRRQRRQWRQRRQRRQRRQWRQRRQRCQQLRCALIPARTQHCPPPPPRRLLRRRMLAHRRRWSPAARSGSNYTPSPPFRRVHPTYTSPPRTVVNVCLFIALQVEWAPSLTMGGARLQLCFSAATQCGACNCRSPPCPCPPPLPPLLLVGFRV